MSDRHSEDEFIEKMGLFFEKSSRFPRIAGKIFAFLLISDPPEQTAGQICERLLIAKSSVSTMMSLLVRGHVVEELTRPGERPVYYRLKKGGWEEMFLLKLQSMTAIRSLLKEGKVVLDGKDPELAARIEDLDGLYAFLEAEIPVLIEKWKDSRRP
ncbi:GbsR/MarR family transcriptional regulator [Methanocella sp. MCL-LM]|uniref:GbsR/MarR family transcriptional regulator n=1 Tax=Methanocella sp. MCL-LM TaxID=3412035 RepID=UPI003C756AB2